MTESAEAVPDLYGLSLEEFTSARDHLVRRLREKGDKDRANEVAKLRKPTTDAWALNQVARSNPGLVERLIESHEALRRAADPGAFRQASEERNRVLGELLDAASEALAQGGHSPEGPVRERITRTLLAAATDSKAEDDLRRGILVRSVEASMGWDLGGPLAADPPDRPEREEAVRAEVENRQAELERLQETAARLREAADAARADLEEARRRAASAEDAARAAEKAARQAVKDLEAARRGR